MRTANWHKRRCDGLALVPLWVALTGVLPGCDADRPEERMPVERGPDPQAADERLDMVRVQLAVDAIKQPMWDAVGDDGMSRPDDPFLRDLLEIEMAFALVLHDGLSHYLAYSEDGFHVDRAIVAFERIEADGWAQMLREGRDTVFPEGVPIGRDAWAAHVRTLGHAVEPRLDQIEARFLYNESLCEDLDVLWIEAARRHGTQGIDWAFTENTEYRQWLREERDRYVP